ncbi:MAG: YegS/Rv2252/BmrU family lipid kinase [Acholeplasmataceae bacterium]|nr:YegS/Rv2252/BmrU family lipid kinase [Acholeplasmataceae bacterium]
MKTLLLYNPKSGNEKFNKRINKIKERFLKENQQLDIYASKKPGDLENQAFLMASQYDRYIVSGGDGSINEVVNGLMKSKIRPALGIIPGGTMNDTANILGIPKNFNKMLDLFLKSKPIKMDINKLNERHFVYVAAVGYLTEVSYEAPSKLKKKIGTLAYLKYGIKSLRKRPHYNLRITYHDKIVEDDLELVIVLAAKRVAGLNLIGFSKKAKLNDGRVELRTFKGRNLGLTLQVLWFALTFGRKQYKQNHIRSDKIKIEFIDNCNLAWNLDGEKGIVGNCEITILKEAIEVYASKRAKKKYF